MNEPDHPVRRFGPTGWALLHVLHDRSVADADELVAHVTIRGLALELGLSKNTIQRALCRLIAAGLVEARQQRTSGGTFSSGHYVLTALVIEPTQQSDRSHINPVDPHHATKSTAPSSDPSGQLSLGI